MCKFAIGALLGLLAALASCSRPTDMQTYQHLVSVTDELHLKVMGELDSALRVGDPVPVSTGHYMRCKGSPAKIAYVIEVPVGLQGSVSQARLEASALTALTRAGLDVRVDDSGAVRGSKGPSRVDVVPDPGASADALTVTSSLPCRALSEESVAYLESELPRPVR